MADYKELLRRAVEALPENNGAARRAVYEKARAALVGQLRAINPPLPARDITTHRLQLEDCIRQVEQEASEAVIAGMGQEAPQPKAEAPINLIKTAPPKPAESVAPPPPLPTAKKGSIEDIIASAERDGRPAPQKIEAKAPELRARPPKSAPVLVARNNPPAPEPEEDLPTEGRPIMRPTGRPLPSIVAKAEAAKAKPAGPVFGTPIDGRGRGGSLLQPRRDIAASATGAAMMRQVEPVPFQLPEDREAMSAVREVEVENNQADPQGSIDRAIATLDREARGDDMDDEPMQAPRRGGAQKSNGAFVEGVGRDDISNGRSGRNGKPSKPAREFATPRRTGRGAEGGVPRAMQERERSGLGAVSIFLIVFVVLLLGAGGAGIWAWQEGFINVDAMFGKNQADVQTSDNVAAAAPNDVATGPGNTETPATTETSTELKADARLPTAATDTAPSETVAPLALQTPAGEAAKTEERLSTASSAEATTAAQATASLDAAAAPGSQSLLLEASDSGTTGAVPFSGTVDWSKGTDENGQPTLVGKANIPARNLSVDILIRKNSDPQLPASHLMEINFSVSNSFVGGSIAGLPGVLLKNEELVQGTPLVGASARVVGNSFLFALSAVPSDSASNITLLTSRKWIDLALIYASGKRAIITLEKDATAEKLFDDVFASWSKTATD